MCLRSIYSFSLLSCPVPIFNLILVRGGKMKPQNKSITLELRVLLNDG